MNQDLFSDYSPKKNVRFIKECFCDILYCRQLSNNFTRNVRIEMEESFMVQGALNIVL